MDIRNANDLQSKVAEDLGDVYYVVFMVAFITASDRELSKKPKTNLRCCLWK